MWLYLVRFYWRYRLGHARDFTVRLEQTICKERVRAAFDLEHCETMAARAEIEIIRNRADKNVRERARA